MFTFLRIKFFMVSFPWLLFKQPEDQQGHGNGPGFGIRVVWGPGSCTCWQCDLNQVLGRAISRPLSALLILRDHYSILFSAVVMRFYSAMETHKPIMYCNWHYKGENFSFLSLIQQPVVLQGELLCPQLPCLAIFSICRGHPRLGAGCLVGG